MVNECSTSSVALPARVTGPVQDARYRKEGPLAALHFAPSSRIAVHGCAGWMKDEPARPRVAPPRTVTVFELEPLMPLVFSSQKLPSLISRWPGEVMFP